MSPATTSSTLSYAVGEKVLCYHGAQIYDAKILNAEVWTQTEGGMFGIPINATGTATAWELADGHGVDGAGLGEGGEVEKGGGTPQPQLVSSSLERNIGPHFFVHYRGWKQSWDEWVQPSRLMKWNEENVAFQKQVNTAVLAKASSSSASTSAANAASNSRGGIGARKEGKEGRSTGGRKESMRGTKRAREEDDGSKKPDLRLNIPEALKIQLVDDWEAITKNNQLVSLPHKISVETLLAEFRDYILALPNPPHPNAQTLLPTIISGLQVYFERSVGANLLYRAERAQYAEMRRRYVTGPKVILGQEKEMISVYGAEHFLRMLVSLPQMVATSSIDPDSVNILRDFVQELMNFLVNEQSRLFQQEYENAAVVTMSVQIQSRGKP